MVKDKNYSEEDLEMVRSASNIVLFSSTALVALATPAIAQGTDGQATADDQSNVIIVTSQKREENVQSVPIAVSAFSSESLQ